MYVRFRLFAFKPNMYRHLALLRPLIFPIRDPSKRVVQVYFLLRDYLFFFFLNREFNKLFFVFRDQKVVRAPRTPRIDKRYSWLNYLFFPDWTKGLRTSYVRTLRDSFKPWLDEVWSQFAWTEIKNSSVKKHKSEQFRTWKDLDRETIFVYSINSFWIRLVVFLWIWIRSNCKIRS